MAQPPAPARILVNFQAGDAAALREGVADLPEDSKLISSLSYLDWSDPAAGRRTLPWSLLVSTLLKPTLI